MKIVLASSSPRRIEYLEQLGFKFDVFKNSSVELIFQGEPVKTVLINAFLKAKKASEKHRKDVVIAMDTIVELENNILGKPNSKKENIEMLSALSGKTHSVVTGVCIMQKNYFVMDYIETKITFRNIDEAEIKRYVSTGEGLDKAGGYAVQGLASDFVVATEGLLDNVIGIPVLTLNKLLNKIKEFKRER